MHHSRKILIMLILALFGSFSVFGQRTASLQLKVVDPKFDSVLRGEVRLLDENVSRITTRAISGKRSVTFENLKPGKLTIEVESSDFELFRKEIVLREGRNSLTAQLEIKKIEVDVEVEQTEIDKRLSRAFSGILTKDEIDSLPDDPREIEKELKRRYGDDLKIRINGFTGGQIPPKEMIRSIQVSRSSFDAEYHELGTPNINIITKAALPKMVGMVLVNYGNSALNSRNAFAREKLPQQNRSFLGFISGPINKKASFTISYNNFFRANDVNVLTITGSGLSSVNESSETSNKSFTGTINYDLGKDITLRSSYQTSSLTTENAGIGGFNLLERGFGVKSNNNEIKASLIGTIKKKYTQQFRSRFSTSDSSSMPNSTNIGITVAGAFSAGGSGINNSSNGNKFEAFEMISFGVGNHFVKLGGELHSESRNIRSSDGTNGSFFFRSVSDFLRRRPSTFMRTIGTSEFSFNRNDVALFVQDDFRVLKRMQIGFGLRYEKQSGLNDPNNFSPRISGAFVLDEKARFVIRSGAGVLYQWHTPGNIERILSNDGSQSSQLVVLNPGFPSPADGGVLLEPLPPSVYRQAGDLNNPYIFITQTALNMNLGDGLKFDTAYKFERGINMFRSRDINAPNDGIRPNAKFGRIRYLESSGSFTRNSLEVAGEGVLFRRVRVNGRYRLSKSTDDFTIAFGLPVDNYNLSLEKGISSLDRRHFFTARFDYSPFRDFRINPSFIFTSPLPYTITTGLDNNRDSVFNDRPLGVARNTERGEWTKTVNLGISWAIPIFKRSISVEKNGEEKPVQNVPNILKYHKLSLSINVNNLFNTTNRRRFIGNQLSPFFLQATSSAPARSITFNFMFLYF